MKHKRDPHGKPAAIEEGAMAEVPIRSKNPLENVAVVEDHENYLTLVIKGGTVFKNEF